MKDARGHGSNSHGGTHSTGFGQFHVKGRPVKADQVARAQKAMASIDNGIHSGQINALPPLERRHYEVMAMELARQGNNAADRDAHSKRISTYADRLASTNPQFNRQRFIEAASGKRK